MPRQCSVVMEAACVLRVTVTRGRGGGMGGGGGGVEGGGVGETVEF